MYAGTIEKVKCILQQVGLHCIEGVQRKSITKKRMVLVRKLQQAKTKKSEKRN